MRIMWFTAVTIAALVASAQCSAESFVQEVFTFSQGSPFAPGFQEEERVFGPPEGSENPFEGSLDVLNLGLGGEIVFRFLSPVIYDATGADFTVFENAFYDQTGGRPEGSTNLETGTVAVSSDGVNFVEFPTDYEVQEPPMEFDYNPDHYHGFAGLNPTLSNPENGISPFDPEVSGGDSFDLEDLRGLPGSEHLDFENIRYLRIRDTGTAPTDSEGDLLPEPPQPGDQGFDLDAVAIINDKPDTGVDLRSSVETSMWAVYR